MYLLVIYLRIGRRLCVLIAQLKKLCTDVCRAFTFRVKTKLVVRCIRAQYCKRIMKMYEIRRFYFLNNLNVATHRWRNFRRDQKHYKNNAKKNEFFFLQWVSICQKNVFFLSHQMLGAPCGTENLQNDHWLVKYLGKICKPWSFVRVSSILKMCMVPWSDDTQIFVDSKLKLMQ